MGWKIDNFNSINYMGKFLTEPPFKRLPDKDGRRQWELTGKLIYESNTVDIIVVPKGYVTDFSSVPRLPFVYWLFGGRGDLEGALHDFLYTAPHTNGAGLTIDRATADKVLRGARYSCDRIDTSEYESVTVSALLNNAWAYFGAWCFWAGVRLFGWRHWG